MITFRPKPQFDKSATLVLLTQKQLRSKDYPFKKEIGPVIKNKRFEAKHGQLFPVNVKNTLVVLSGLGKANVSSTKIRIALKNALTSSFLKKVKDVEIVPHEQKDNTIVAVVEGVVLGTYSWDKYKSKANVHHVAKKVALVTNLKDVGARALKVAEATNFARDLINENAGVATSDFLHKTIKGLIKGKKNITTEVLKEKEMKAKGLNLHLAVNQGSQHEPRLVIVKYAGGKKSEDYTALIGKGMTFDTGGLNLKPTGSIESMKLDMSGAAAVIGALKAAIDLKLKKNVLFVCGIAENCIDSKAYRPGDVITGYAKKSVEIGNTDAEGRLVLADAISYVVKNYKPKEIIDIATLTGACIVALGNDYSGLCTTDDRFSRDLVHSSNVTDDRVWRLPVYDELKTSVRSKVADIRNLGWPKGAGGAITAAEFLHQFTENTRWAHLDIAGTSFVDGESRWYFGPGGTGAGVRLLTHYLQHYA